VSRRIISSLSLCVLNFYHSELRSRESQEMDGLRGEGPLILLPLEVMVKPLEMRFRYHFDGDRPTNRPDKVRGTPLAIDLYRVLMEAAGVLLVAHNRPFEHVQ